MKKSICFLIILFCFILNCFAQIEEDYFGAPISETRNIILEYGLSFNNLKIRLPSLQRSYNDKYTVETVYKSFDLNSGKTKMISYIATYSINSSSGLYSVEFRIEAEDFDLLNKLFSEYENNFNKQYGEADYTRRSGTTYAFWQNRNSIIVAIIRFQTNPDNRMLIITWQSSLPEHRNLIIGNR